MASSAGVWEKRSQCLSSQTLLRNLHIPAFTHTSVCAPGRAWDSKGPGCLSHGLGSCPGAEAPTDTAMQPLPRPRPPRGPMPPRSRALPPPPSRKSLADRNAPLPGPPRPRPVPPTRPPPRPHPDPARRGPYPVARLDPLVDEVGERLAGDEASSPGGDKQVPILQHHPALTDDHRGGSSALEAFKNVVLHVLGRQGEGWGPSVVAPSPLSVLGAGSILGGWCTGSRSSDKAGPRWRGRSLEGTAYSWLFRPLSPVLGTEGAEMSH